MSVRQQAIIKVAFDASLGVGSLCPVTQLSHILPIFWEQDSIKIFAFTYYLRCYMNTLQYIRLYLF